MSVKVSVILPSLNVGRYIAGCLESVIGQSLREIEMICVDAGSTDGTLEILRRYEAADDRIRVICSDKKSYGRQMNMGMAAAKGEYVGIVETDDFILPGMYEELYRKAKDNDADFVKADFYRFTGEGENIRRALYRLSGKARYYDCIIDVEKTQECFSFPMNTWSGIYKREFLIKNNIRHNETPGASYQDTGFWFQTFVYAKRAYFVDRAYYMNRRDNPDSSVFSKSKVYCASDEYRYILNILRRDEALWNRFRHVYAVSCYQAYKGSLGRMAQEYRAEFIARFAEDFRELERLGALKKECFHDTDWRTLCFIMKNPQDYYRHFILIRESLYEQARRFERIIIFGAGMVGKRTFQDLKEGGYRGRIVCFAVSQRQGNLNKYKDIPVIIIDELLAYRKNSLVVIAVSAFLQQEIKDRLEALGFENVFPLPE